MDSQLNYVNQPSRFETGIGPMTDRILNTVTDKLSAPEFRDKITQKIMTPVTQLASQKLKPYLKIVGALYLVVVLLLVVIIYLLIKRNKTYIHQ